MGGDDFCAELNYCIGTHGDGMNAGEGGEFVDEGLLGAGYWGGRKAAAGRGGCGHLAGTQVLAEFAMGFSWIYP